MEIGIIGTGMFGFSLARHLGGKYLGDDKIVVKTFDSNSRLMEHLNKHRRHLYHFKNKRLPQKVSLAINMRDLIKDADVLVLAVNSQAIRETMRGIKKYLKDKVIILNTAKALEIGTAKTFSEVIKEELNSLPIKYTVAKLSGGTFSEDLVNDAPLGADIACENMLSLKKLQEIFSSSNLRIYGNNDLIGVEYAGAFKNVIAIFAGILNGIGLPYGSETHMISRAAKEAKEVAVALGAKSHTFSMESQCWGNDLWMSCTGISRNRDFGISIGRGMDAKSTISKMQSEHKLVEGYYTTGILPQLSKKAGVQIPIMAEIHNIIYKGKNAKQSVSDLMTREPETII